MTDWNLFYGRPGLGILGQLGSWIWDLYALLVSLGLAR